MSKRDHARFADDIAPYLLRALDERERKAFEKHLKRCSVCRDEVAELAPAADVLPRSVDPVAPPPGLKAALMAEVRADQQRKPAPAGRTAWLDKVRARPALAAAAAAAVVALGIGTGAIVGAIGGDSDTRTIAATVDADRLSGARAELVVSDDGKGAILRASGMEKAPPGRVYEVWLKRGDTLQPSSLFAVARDGSAAAAIPESVEGVDAVLVTREPEGGSDRPSEQPVLSIDVAG